MLADGTPLVPTRRPRTLLVMKASLERWNALDSGITASSLTTPRTPGRARTRFSISWRSCTLGTSPVISALR